MPLEKKGAGDKEKPTLSQLEERVKYLELQVREAEGKLRLRDAQTKLRSSRSA